jgi:beta-glucanase (GH16 family)
MRITHAIRGVAASAALFVGAIAGVPTSSAHTRGRKAPNAGHDHRSTTRRHRPHRWRGRHRRARLQALPALGLGAAYGGHAHRHQPPRQSPPAPAVSAPTPAPVAAQVPAPPAPPATQAVQPLGAGDNWNLVFDDEFNGSAIDASVWNEHDGWTDQNSVIDHAANVTEGGGVATLTLASPSSGATISTNAAVFAVGDFAEARVDFAGAGTTIYGWPAWWASGPSWPAAGENDIAEGLGTLTVNYHSPSGTHNQGTVPGDWADAFHTYGIYRGAGYCDVYWDGQLVKRYRTDDNGQPEQLIFTVGAGNDEQLGSAGQMQIDYVRVWAPA